MVNRPRACHSALLLFLLGTFSVLSLFSPGHARAVPPDPAARGLDVYVHVAPGAAPGGVVELVAKAYGFPSVTHAVPLAGATLEIGWDPEELDGQAPPPSVVTRTDGEGRARIAIGVPRGLPRKLQLLVAVRHGSHARTRIIPIARGTSAGIEIHTAERRVVPSSTISAWVRVVGTGGEPLADTGVIVSLLEGGIARHQESLRTDRGGLVMARVPIPRIDEPVWSWTLRAQTELLPAVPFADVTLVPREENPGLPVLEAEWRESVSGVLPGERANFKLRVRDATGQPVIEHAVRYWIGPKGTAVPQTDKDWERASTRAVTDGAGEISGTRDAPTLVKSSGTALTLVARAVVEGHALERKTEITVGVPNASAVLTPEVPAIVPGLSQRMMLAVRDGRGAGIEGAFTVTGDGLAASVTTDARGEAEITWNAPPGVGATRNVGPCAGGVAAAVVVRPVRALEALRSQAEPFTLCVSVDRDAAGIVRAVPDVARPGEKVRITVVPSPGAAGAATVAPHSVVMRSQDRDQAAAAWLEVRPDGTSSGDITVPADAAAGLWEATVALPSGARGARLLGARVLVVPAIAPMLTATRAGGRPTPGGVMEFDAQLTDGRGRGLAGAVSAIVVDAFGGGSANVSALDTRSRLCAAVAADTERCSAVIDRDPATEALRRALLARSDERRSVSPVNDPGANVSRELEKAFADVLHSLEGAVLEASKAPRTLIDARRKDNGRWVMNPELLTLVTDAMEETPLTPGGEKLVLADLVAVDPQVTFDNVARRVTRLKLFTVLAAVRATRIQRSLDPDEPVFKDPNALLRRLVRDATIPEDALLDPWGGTIQYVRGGGAGLAPFLGSIRGFELRAPGPDGLVGTGDDVRDPFERVVRSGSPYARAVDEDRIVDAKWDMVVSEATVAAWEQLFQELTGQALGKGVGLSGNGEGGGGRGEGLGLGNIGSIGHGAGHGRASTGIANGDASWTAPVRTDAEGRVHLSIPLGAAETTWRVAFVGVPDGLGPASTTADVASDLPLSLRIDGGARWVEGDVVETNVLVRNRTDAPIRATLEASAEGAAALDERPAAPRTIDVPARGARNVRVKVRAARAGEGRLVLVARAAGLPEDVLRHNWEIAPAGEARALTQTAWVDGDRELRLALDQGYRLAGVPRLVLERGYDDAIAGALDSLEPEAQKSAHALVDALEASVRVQRWATTRDSARHRALAAIAESSAARAHGRFNVLTTAAAPPRGAPPAIEMVLQRRAAILTMRSAKEGAEETPATACPPEADAARGSRGSRELSSLRGSPLAMSTARADDDDVLEIEPPPGVAVPACWGAFVSATTRSLAQDGEPESIARALMALAERPHRAAITATLADRLRRLVKLDGSGEIDPSAWRESAALSTPATSFNERARRATVYAALLRTQRLGTSPATADALFGKLATLRDVTGGYGSSAATLAVVRALLSSQLEGHGTTRAQVRVAGSGASAREAAVDVPPSGFVVVPLPAGTLEVSVRTAGPGLIARFERPVLRLWSRPPPPQASPIGIDVVWPADATAGATGTLRVMLRHPLDEVLDVDARVPLPPGVTLGAATKGVAQVQGVLAMRQSVDRSGAVIEIPVRFGLAGKTTAPEATARIARSSSGIATAPARALVVR